MKKNKICTSFIFLVFLIILFLPNFVLADDDSPSYEITDYIVNATINIDGSMHIDEYLTYYFSSSANGLTRDLRYYYKTDKKDTMEPESPRYQASGIKNLSVEVSKEDSQYVQFERVNEAQNGDIKKYTVENINEDDTKGYFIKVYSPISSYNSQTVKYSYDVEDIIVQYNNMCELYYNFIGNGFEVGVKNFKLNIKLPNEISINDTKVFPHTYATKLENIKISKNNETNSITLEVKDIPAEKPLDTRIVFPHNNLFDCSKFYNEDYNLENLNKIENNMAQGNSRYFLHININGVICLIALILFIIFLIYSTLKTKKYKYTVKKVSYFRDIPKKLNLLQYQLLLPLKVTDSLNSNIIIATILDLVNKKAINMEVKSNPSRKGKIKYDYNLSLNKEYDFSSLQPYESQIISLLFSDTISTNFDCNNYFDINIELNDRFKEISKDNKLIQQINSARSNKLINVKDMYYNLPNKTIKCIFIVMFILIILLAINTLIISPTNKGVEFFIGLFAIIFTYLILFCIVNDKYKIVMDEYKEDANELYGLYKYLKDYSLIKDRYPIEINLWNEYLVFASLFGIAEKVSSEFKEELINRGYSDDQIYLTYPILSVSIYSNSFTNSINSSTGYSGSGSGGGGGGGGGAGAF